MQQRHRQSPTLSFLLVLALLSTLVLAFLQSASAWPQNAGTVCSMTGSSLSDMTGSKHGSAKSGNGGFAVSTVATAQSDGSYQITLAGSSYRGLVLLARNDAGTLVGAFSGYPSGLSAKTDCDGPAGSILEHNSASTKSLPLTVNWTPDSSVTAGSTITFEAMVVVTTRNWYIASAGSLVAGGSAAPTTETTTTETTTTTQAAASTASSQATATGSASNTKTTTSSSKTTTTSSKSTTTTTSTSDSSTVDPGVPEADSIFSSYTSYASSPAIFYTLWATFLVLGLSALATRSWEHSVDKSATDKAVLVAAGISPESLKNTSTSSRTNVQRNNPYNQTLGRTVGRDVVQRSGNIYDPWADAASYPQPVVQMQGVSQRR